MSNRLAIIGLSLLAGFSTSTVLAQTGLNGQTTIPTTAVPFLRISPDARSGAMGDVGLAISPDANAQYWNVAKIPFSEKKFGISATYTPWLKDLVPDIFLAYLSAYAKFGENNNQAISGSLRYFSLGDINYTDINATPVGTGKPREFSIDLGYSRKLSDYLSVGLSGRYIHSAIATGLSGQQGTDYKPGSTASADMGVYYNKTKEITEYRSTTWSFGAALTNLGGKISYNSTRKDFIPLNLGIGAAFTYQVDEYNKFTIAADLNKLLVPAPTDTSTSGIPAYDMHNDMGVIEGMFKSFGDPAGAKRIDASIGAEYWYQNQFAVRAGYFYESPSNGDRQYFTCGLGVRYNIFNLNFSYLIPSGSGINRNPLSNTLRFSLMFEFDKLGKQEASE